MMRSLLVLGSLASPLNGCPAMAGAPRCPPTAKGMADVPGACAPSTSARSRNMFSRSALQNVEAYFVAVLLQNVQPHSAALACSPGVPATFAITTEFSNVNRI